MSSFLSRIKTCTVVSILIANTFITGCGENPERAADKKANAAIEAAVKEYASTRDFDKTQKVLKQALAGGAANQEVVLLLQGSLDYGKAAKTRKELAPLWDSTEKNLGELSGIVAQITQTQVEKGQIEASLRSRQEERRQLAVQLDGDANGPGLTAKLKEAQAKLTDLKSKQSEFSQQLSEKLKQAAELQRQADELLAAAEQAQGEKKAQLQNQASEVLLGSAGTAGKNAYLSEAQDAQDKLNTVESEITMVEPKVATLTNQIERTQKRIDELDKSDFAAKSKERLTTIGSTITHFQEELTGTLSQVEQTQSQSATKVKDITELLSSAQKNFKKVTSEESLKDLARVAAAETAFYEGNVRSDCALWQRHLAARLAILTSGEATDSQTQLKTLAQRYLDDSEEFVSKALADYNDAANMYGKIPVKKDEFNMAVLKNRILVLAQKAYLAQQVENMGAKAQAIEQAKELIDRVKNDQAFEASMSQPPYNIVTGKTAEKAAAEQKPVEEANEAAEPNKPAVEPNQSVAEPNQPAVEPNQTP